MSSTKAIGIRVNTDMLKKIDKLCKEDSLDRSTEIRVLMEEGYKQKIMKKAMEDYKKGKITISAAGKITGLTIWEFQQYMINQGFRSEYSTKDIEKELSLLEQ